MDIKSVQQYTKTLRVLCVEDEKSALEANKRLFSNFFKEIVCAENGEEAWKIWQSQDFDLLITDLTMPKMGGAELIRKIRERNPYAHIIVLTAHNEQERLIESINLHVDGFLLKPIDLPMLLDLLLKVSREILLEKELSTYKKEIASLRTRYSDFSGYLQEEYAFVQLQLFVLHNKKHFYVLALVINQLLEILEYFGIDVYEKIIHRCYAHLKKIAQERGYPFFHLRPNEFVFLLENEQKESVYALAHNLQSLCIEVDGALFNVKFSHAIAEGSGDELIKSIDESFIKIEQAGKFLALEEKQRNDKFWILKKITKLVKENAFTYAKQPIFDREGTIKGYEILCRLMEDESENCQNIIEIAKAAGIIHKVTINILQKAMQEVDRKLFINISAQELECKELRKYLQELPTRNSIIEITPSLLFNKRVQQELWILKKMGFAICLCESGKEIYSLDIFQKEKCIDFIKFDKSVIAKITQKENYRHFIASHIEFFHSLAIETIALGIETQEEYKKAYDLGFDYFQGYFLGMPQRSKR